MAARRHEDAAGGAVFRPAFFWRKDSPMTRKFRNRDVLLCILFAGLSLALLFMPTGFEERVQASGGERAKGLVLSVDNSGLQKLGIITKGNQEVKLRITEGRFKGQLLDASNQLMGRMDLDKIFAVGDHALVVITVDNNDKVVFVNPQDHYRLGWELLVLGLFSLLLVVFGGFTGLRALLSFVFAGLMIWKVLVPGLLRGYDPLWLALLVVAALTASIIFLVAGPTKKGLTAFGGAMLGVIASCLLAVYFTEALHLHGAVMPFAETLLYSGFPHLDLVRIYIAAVFLAASGAVMDLAMDVAASMDEVVSKKTGHQQAGGASLRVFGGPGRGGHHDHHLAPGLFRGLCHPAHGLHGPGRAAGQHVQLDLRGGRGFENPGGQLRPGHGGSIHRSAGRAGAGEKAQTGEDDFRRGTGVLRFGCNPLKYF